MLYYAGSASTKFIETFGYPVSNDEFLRLKLCQSHTPTCAHAYTELCQERILGAQASSDAYAELSVFLQPKALEIACTSSQMNVFGNDTMHTLCDKPKLDQARNNNAILDCIKRHLPTLRQAYRVSGSRQMRLMLKEFEALAGEDAPPRHQ